MALIDDIPNAREWHSVAKQNGISYETYVARLVHGDMPPEVAATKPVRYRKRPETSIRAACEYTGVCRRTVYNHMQTLREAGLNPDPFDIIEVLRS